MNRLENVLACFFMVGLISVGALFSFYAVVFVLPIILFVIAGYALYVYIKTWQIRKKLKEMDYFTDFMDASPSDDKIIDAEFEIVEEKTYK